MKVPQTYFQSNDVVFLARDLLGKSLFTKINGKLTGGIITETEAYAGITDRASHAYGGRRTNRTEIMFQNGGVSYIYLCYGIHHLFNIVTGEKEIPHAILIRGIYPTTGIDTIMRRRKNVKFNLLANGPGKVSSCLNLGLEQNAKRLNGKTIWIEDTYLGGFETDIKVGRRVGINYAGEDALLPYRFILNIKKAPQLLETLL